MSVEVSGILMAAHELKAPLCLLRQLSLALGVTDDVNAKRRLEAQMVEVSDRALRQVNDLSRIARLEDGLFTSEPVSVRGVCQAVLQEIEPLFHYENRNLAVNFSNKSRLAVANRDLLYSIVYNFCVNAVHYSEPESKSTLTVSDTQDKIRVKVRDFGPALPTKVWRAICAGNLSEPTAIAMRPGSSGLGLYISAQFARHMHARLGAVRHHDGTSFFIDLPISKQTVLAF